ncbi:MAG: AAA family ATPase [Roseibium album]|uniref:chloramphenicol phosphotransferase CPT family protein n=1 Tax=Roseibium album TaxID=311410 RepID=UPI0032EB8ED8
MDEGKIIFLNGSSSAGKTTIAMMLQQILEEPWQHIALDQFRDGMPGRYRGLNSPEESPGARGLNVVPTQREGELVTQIRFGDHGEQVLRGMRRAVAAFAREGNNVIIDDLLFKPDYLYDYAQALSGLDAWLIGVRCTLDVVNRREALRSGRFPGTATSHFHEVHAHGADYDLEVDASHSAPRACAERIVERLRQRPTAFETLRDELQAD